MGFFKKKQSAVTTTASPAAAAPSDLTADPATAYPSAPQDAPPKKDPLSKRLLTKRTQLTSQDSTARLAARDRLANRQARVSYVTGHAGTQLAIWGARTGGDVTRRAAAAAGGAGSALGPLGQTLSALAMFGAVAPLLTAYGDVLDLANEIERKIVNFIVLADTAYDMFKSRVTRDAITERQLVEVKVILEKMEATTGQAMEVLDKVQNMGLVKVTMNVATLKNEFAPIRVKVTNLLKTLHARITTIQLALFDAQANQAQVLRDGLAATADVARGWMSGAEKDVIAAIRQSDEGHKEVAIGLRELLKEIEDLGVPPGVYKHVKNKEVLALWTYLFGNAGPVVEASEFVETCAGLGMHLYASSHDESAAELLFAWTAPLATDHAGGGVLAPKELGLFDPHMDPSGEHVSLLALDKVCEQVDEDVLQPVNVPTLLLWRVYAWTGFSQSLLDLLIDLSKTLPLVSSALLTPLTTRLASLLASLRDLWHATPTVRHRIDQLMPLLSFSRAGSYLVPCAQALVDALTALVQLMSPMANVARNGTWLYDPESLDASEYTAEFPEQVARAWNKVVDAARGMCLDCPADTIISEAQVAEIKQALALALEQQQEAMSQLIDLTSPADFVQGTFLDTAFGALITDWSLLAQLDPIKRTQPLSESDSLLLVTHDEAAFVLPPLARLLPALATAPHVTRVTGVLIPQPGVCPHWGIVLSTTNGPVRSLHDALATSPALSTRIKLARDIVRGVLDVRLASARWAMLDPDLTTAPLELSPHTIAVSCDAMGTPVAHVPPCAGVVPFAVTAWDAAYVAPDAPSGGSVSVDAAAAADVFALGKVVARLLQGLGADKGGETLEVLVGRMCHSEGKERVKVTLDEVLAKLDMIARQADLDAIPVEDLAIVVPPSVAPAADAPVQFTPPSPPPAPELVPPLLPPYPTLSRADAQANFHTARNRIRSCTGRPLSDPNYDVDDTLTLLLSAGMPGHVPMALVLAADLWYYGVIQPRAQPDCWTKARYLYARAAEFGCKYANVGLGDLVYFALGEQGGVRVDRVTTAERYYQLALEHVDNPGANLDLTEVQQARVYCGLGDVLFARADALAAGGDPAGAHRLWVRSLAYFQQAHGVDPRCKRALARKALFKVRQVGGEQWDRTLVLAWKQAARSRDNPVPELMVRLSLYEMDGDERGAEAVKRMIAAADVPEH